MIKIKDILNKFGNSENQNNKNKKTTIFVIGLIVCFGIFKLALFIFNDGKPSQTVKNKAAVVNTISDDFTAEDQQSELTQQQESLDEYKEKLRSIQEARKEDKLAFDKKINKLSDLVHDIKSGDNQEIQDLKAKINSQPTNLTKNNKANQSDKDDNLLSNNSTPTNEPITFDSTTFTYASEATKEFKKTWKNYVSSGSYCRAVMLSGADARAGVESSSNTTPVLFKVQDCWLTGDHHTFALKNAIVVGSIYGDVGQSRGVVRLETISFADPKDGEIYDMPVDGTVSDISGRNGIKGITVLRNGKILMASGVAGLISGIGSATQQLGTTQSIGAGGVINTYDPSKIGYSVAGGAIQKAGDTLSSYYIELAEAYSPIIEIRAGSVDTIIFQHGFPYRDKDAIKKYSETMAQARIQETQNSNSQKNNIATVMHHAISGNLQQNSIVKQAVSSVQNNQPLNTSQQTAKQPKNDPFG